MSHLKAEIGNWYQNHETKQLFEIVAMDEDDGTIEVQYLDGEIEELDVDTWKDLELEEAAEPEDWAAAYEMMKEDNPDDLGTGERPENWSGIDEVEP